MAEVIAQFLPGLWSGSGSGKSEPPQFRQVYPGFIGPVGTVLPTPTLREPGSPPKAIEIVPRTSDLPPSVPAGVSTADAGPAPPAVPAPAGEKNWRPQFHSRPAGGRGPTPPGSCGGGGGSGGSSGGADDGGGSDGGGGGGGRSLGGGSGDDETAAGGGGASARIRRVVGGSTTALATPPRPTRRATGEGVALGGAAAPDRADLGPLAAARAFEREMDALLDQILAEGGLESGGEDEGGAEGVAGGAAASDAEGDAESPAPLASAYSEAREIDLALNRLKPHATRPAAFEIDLQGERYVVGGTKGGTQYVFRVPDEGTPWPGGLTRRSASHNWRGAAVPPRYMQEAVAGAP